jgi:hypothetical protein
MVPKGIVLMADRVTVVEPLIVDLTAFCKIVDGGIVDVGVIVGLVTLVGELLGRECLLPTPKLTPTRMSTMAHPTSTNTFGST